MHKQKNEYYLAWVIDHTRKFFFTHSLTHSLTHTHTLSLSLTHLATTLLGNTFLIKENCSSHTALILVNNSDKWPLLLIVWLWPWVGLTVFMPSVPFWPRFFGGFFLGVISLLKSEFGVFFGVIFLSSFFVLFSLLFFFSSMPLFLLSFLLSVLFFLSFFTSISISLPLSFSFSSPSPSSSSSSKFILSSSSSSSSLSLSWSLSESTNKIDRNGRNRIN